MTDLEKRFNNYKSSKSSDSLEQRFNDYKKGKISGAAESTETESGQETVKTSAASVKPAKVTAKGALSPTGNSLEDAYYTNGSSPSIFATEEELAAQEQRAKERGYDKNLSVWDRIGLSAKSGVQQYGGSNLGTMSAGYEFGQPTRSKDTQESIEILNNSLARYQKGYEEELAAGNTEEAEFMKGLVDQTKDRLAAYGQVEEAQEGATKETLDMSQNLIDKSTESLDRATYGTNGLGRALLQAEASTVQTLMDTGANTLLYGGIGLGSTLSDGTTVTWNMVKNAVKSGAAHSYLPFITRSFGGSYTNARNSGADYSSSIAYATAQTLKEVATEEMLNLSPLTKQAYGSGIKIGDNSLDTLISDAIENAVNKWATSDAGKKALRLALITGESFLEEGLEEFVGDWAEYLTNMEGIIGNDRGTLSDVAKQSLEDFIIGGLSGLMGSANQTVNDGVHSMVNSVQDTMYGKNVLKGLDETETQDTKEWYVNRALQGSEEESKIAQSLNGNVTAQNIGQMERAKQNTEYFRTQGAKDIVSAIGEELTNEEIDNIRHNPEALNMLSQETGIQFDNKASVKEQRSAIKDSLKQLANQSNESLSEAQANAQMENKTSQNGSFTNRYLQTEKERRSIIKEGKNEFSKSIDSMSENIGESGKTAFDQIVKGSGDINKAAAFFAYYSAGENQTIKENIPTRYLGIFSDDELRTIYKAGVEDGLKFKADTVTESTERPKIIKGEFIKEGSPENLDDYTKDALGSLARYVGLNIRYFGNTGDNGFNALINDDEILLANDAVNPIEVVLAHEVTHRMQELSPEAYNRYKVYVRDNYEKVGNLKFEMQAQKDARKKLDGKVLSDSEALDEVVADFTENIIGDLDAFRDFASADKETSKSLLDIIRDIIKGKTSIKEVIELKKFYKEASDLWNEMYAEGTEAVDSELMYDFGTDARPIAENDSSVAIDEEGNVMFSVKPPFSQKSKNYKQFADSLDSKARETFELFEKIRNTSARNKVSIRLNNGNMSSVNIAMRYMTAQEWNRLCESNKKFQEKAAEFVKLLPEDVRTNGHFFKNGKIEATDLETRFKMKKSFMQRVVDALPAETLDSSYMIGGKTYSMGSAEKVETIGGESYRRALLELNRRIYKDSLENKTKRKAVSINTLAKDTWGTLGWLRGNQKTGGTGDFTTLCPQMFYNDGCWYCYRRAALESNVDNANVGENIWYTGELLRLSPEAVTEMNRAGGLRIQSFGDWFDRYNFQLADVLADAAMVKDSKGNPLQVKIVTKEPSMIEAVANLKEQGLGESVYFNISVDFTLEQYGKIKNQGNKNVAPMNPARPVTESEIKVQKSLEKHFGRMWKRALTLDEAIKYREKYDWVKIRAVAINQEEFIYCLQNPNVDVVTGYHGKVKAGDKINRISTLTGEVNPIVEPIGDHGMPVFERDRNGVWHKTYEGKNDFQKSLGNRIQEEGLELEYASKVCCITGECASCQALCGTNCTSSNAMELALKNLQNRDFKSREVWRVNEDNLMELKEVVKFSPKNIELTSDDLEEYMSVGKRKHVRDTKSKMLEKGINPILSSRSDFSNYISDIFNNKIGDEIRAFAKVGGNLADLIKHFTGLEVYGNYLEVNSGMLKESMNEHIRAKEEGDSDLSIEDFKNIPSMLDSELLFIGYNTHKEREQIHFAYKTEDGYIRILTIVSTGRGSLQVTKLVGNSKEKFESKYPNVIKKNADYQQERNASNHLKDVPYVNSILNDIKVSQDKDIVKDIDTSSYNEKQKKSFDYNQKQTEVGHALKTLNDSRIGRSTKFGVGKDIGGGIYVHKDYASEVVPKNAWTKAQEILKTERPDFKYNAVMYDVKNGTVRFDEAPDFDTAREPITGDYITVSPYTGKIVKEGHTDYIWHHKWEWVKNDYKGFNVEESWNWSKEWLSILKESSDGNGIARWNAQLDKYGLPHDAARYSTKDILRQEHTSADTSINSSKIPSLYTNKNAVFVDGGINIDIGAGKFDTATDYLESKGVTSLPFDPFNRKKSVNLKVLDFLRNGNKADTATCSNVLNVIDTAEGRANVILEMAKAIKPEGVAYFTVYENKANLEAGKAGQSKNKPDQWQEFRATKTYVDEVKQYFNDVSEPKGGLIIARDPKQNLPKAIWQLSDKRGTVGETTDEFVRFSTKNSVGDELSKGQTEYFKGSKIRDEDGNLLVVYHGTEENFTIFDRTKSRANMDIQGNFFTPWLEEAEGYGSKVGKYYLNITNPASESEGYKALNKFKGQNDAGIKAREYLISLGYDGVLNYDEFIAFYPEQIKSIDNLNPTSNPDIRFSAKGVNTQKQITKENEVLKEKIAEINRLKKELKESESRSQYGASQLLRTETIKARAEDVNRLTKDIIKAYDSKINAKELAKKVQNLADYIKNNDIDADKAKEMSMDIARDVVQNAFILSGDIESEKSILDYLRTTQINVPKNVRDDIGDYNAWRLSHGKMRLSSTGTDIDQVWQELQGIYGTGIFPDDIHTTTEQLVYLAGLSDTLTQNWIPAFSDYELADATELLANQILDKITSDEVRRVAPTFADKMEAKIKDQEIFYRGKITKLQDANRRLRKYVAEHEDWYTARDVENGESAERKKLLSLAQRLERMSKKTTKANREWINEFIGELDTISMSLTKRKMSELKDIKEWYENELENNNDFDADPRIEKMISRLSKNRISDMDIETVRELTDILKWIEHEITNERKLIAAQDRRDTYMLGAESIEDIKSSKGNKGTLLKWVNTETLSPVRQMHRYTGYKETSPLYQVTLALADGQRKMFDFQRKANETFRKYTEDTKFMKEIQGKDAKEIEIQGLTKDGVKTVKITPSMMISLYLHSKNWQNMHHIRTGGISIPDMKLYKAGEIEEAYNKATIIQLEPSDIRRICTQMTQKERDFADDISWYFNHTSQNAINQTSEMLKGYSLADVYNYFPINTDSSFTKSEFESIKMDGTIEGMGFLKERVNASNAILLRDANSVLKQSIDMTGKYVGLAIPVRNFNKIWNVGTRTWTDDGNSLTDSSVKKAMKEVWGSEGYRYIEKMMADVNGVKRNERTSFDEVASKIRSNYAGAVLTLNASVALKQAASYPTAAAVLGWNPLIKAFTQKSKVDSNLIARYTPLFWYRSQGFSTQELGDLTKLDRKLPKAFNWIQAIDLATTKQLWKASEIYVRENSKLAYGTDTFYKEVAKVYNRVIEETQPNYTTMQRPQILRSESTLLQSLMMFKTQPFQNYNILADAFGNYQAKLTDVKNNVSGAKESCAIAKKNLVNSITAQIGSTLTIVGMTLAWAALRGKLDPYEDEEGNVSEEALIETITSNLAGQVPFGSEAYEIVNVLFKSLIGEDYTYYGTEEITAGQINDLVEALTSLTDMANDEDLTAKKTMITIDSAADSISKAFGVPYENITNMINIFIQQGMIAAEGEYAGKMRFLLMTKNESYKTTFYDLLYKAYANDTVQYNECVKMLVQNGFTKDGIKNAIKNRIAK